MEGKVILRLPSTGAKVIKMITAEGKVIMRLPSTGAKVIKMITEMENGDTCDRYDALDTLLAVLDGSRQRTPDGLYRMGVLTKALPVSPGRRDSWHSPEDGAGAGAWRAPAPAPGDGGRLVTAASR